MSVHVMVAIFDADGLTSTEKLVALAYAEHGHDDGSEARAGVERICQYTALSRRTVQTTLKALLDKKVLYVDRPATNKRPTCYRFFLTSDGKNLSFGRGATVAPQEPVGGATDDALGRESCAQTVSEPLVNTLLLDVTAEPRLPNEVMPAKEQVFDRLWESYPRKVGKIDAMKAIFARLKAGVHPNDLYTATINYASLRAGSDQSFTMHPKTFFGSGERFRDYLGSNGVDPVLIKRNDDESDAEWEMRLARRNRESVPMPESMKELRKKMRGNL